MGAETAGAPAGLLLGAAIVLVALMGVAIQRGSTCLVAAVDEAVTFRTTRRLCALALAAILAGAVFVLAGRPAGTGAVVPAALITVAGAMLLGLGAIVNRACVVGTVARIGAGEWAFLFTPLGIFVASLVIAHSPGPTLSANLARSSPAAGPLVIILLFLLGAPLVRDRLRRLRHWGAAPAARLLGPHLATAVIGLLFGALAAIGVPWSYADALGHLARTGMAQQPALHLMLMAVLLASARLAGHVQGFPMQARQTVSGCLRCFAGGAVMTVGAALVPGSNDMLLLEGAPLLQLHALLALTVMAVTIACLLLMRRRFLLP